MRMMSRKAPRKLFSGVLCLARGTSLLLGLTVMLALVVGVTSSALAGTGVGGVFNLGQANTVNTISRLVGSVDNAVLRVTNTNASGAATALDLRVTAGKPPMTVNSEAKVTSLNADKLDGLDSMDFTPKTYATQSQLVVWPNMTYHSYANCDYGDVALSGGFRQLDSTSSVVASFGSTTDEARWNISIKSAGDVDDTVILSATCADYGKPHEDEAP